MERVLDGKKTLALREILAEEMPDILAAVAHYRAKRMYDADSPVLLTPHRRYSYQNADVQENLEALRSVIIQETVFTLEEVIEMCRWSFRFQVAALIQPRSKLLDLLFQKGKTGQVKAPDVLVVLAGFDRRRRIIDELCTAIASSGLPTFDRERLARMSFAAGTALFRETPISTILSETTAYLRFESSVSGTQINELSFSVLLAMLDEWGLEPIASALKEEYDEDKTWTPAEIEGAFGRHLVIGATSNQAGRKSAPAKPRLDGVQLRRKAQARRRAEVEALQFNFLDDPELDAPADKGDAAAGALVSATHGDPPAMKTTIGAADRASAPDKDEEKEILRQVFANNEADYTAFMQRISATRSWKQAQGEIEKELSSRRIGPFAKESSLLSGIVFLKYFSQKDLTPPPPE